MAEYMANQSPDQPGSSGQAPYHTPGFTSPIAPLKKSPKKKLVLAAVIVAVLIVAGVLYVVFGSKKAAAPKPVSNSTNTSQNSGNQASGNSATSQNASGLQTYKSTKLNIEFTYPGGWSMKENTDKSVITLASGPTTYTKKDGTSTNGVFTLRLRNGIVSDAMKQNIQNAVAMRDSEVIAYDKPTDQQRQYTNISFGGSGPNTNFFVVSGSVAFKDGEAFGSNIDLEGAVYLFAGGYGADSADAMAFDAVPKASFEGSAYKQALGIVKSMKIY